MKKQLRDGDIITHLAKIGSDFATGHGRKNMKKESEYDEDGSHNTGFQTINLVSRGKELFRNPNPGGSELLRLTSKTMQKDTTPSMVANMSALDELVKDVEDQVGSHLILAT